LTFSPTSTRRSSEARFHDTALHGGGSRAECAGLAVLCPFAGKIGLFATPKPASPRRIPPPIHIRINIRALLNRGSIRRYYRIIYGALYLRPEEVMMCAAHSDDLRSAASNGLRTAHIARPGENGPGTGESAPRVSVDFAAKNMETLATQLGV